VTDNLPNYRTKWPYRHGGQQLRYLADGGKNTDDELKKKRYEDAMAIPSPPCYVQSIFICNFNLDHETIASCPPMIIPANRPIPIDPHP